jgi:hypothetical protein
MLIGKTGERRLSTKNSFMKKSAEGITNASKDLCRAMLDSEQDPPSHELAPDVDFGVSEQLDSQVSDDPQHLSQRSEADSLSTIEQNDNQASLAMSQEATPNTSFSEQKFKKPKRGPKV